MTRPDIPAIKARAEAATAGPWHIEVDGVNDLLFVDCDHNAKPWNYVAEATSADRAFINASRLDVPALCDRVEALEAALRLVLPHAERWAEGGGSGSPEEDDVTKARAALEGK